MSERNLGLRCRPKLEILEERCTPANYYVNTNDDTNLGNPGNGEGTLRWCIEQANASVGVSDTILINTGVNVVLKSALPMIGDIVAIYGIGSSDQTSVTRDATAGLFRIFKIDIGANVTLRNMRVLGGDAGTEDGGGILNLGTLRMFDMKVGGNEATNGGGVANNNTGSLTIDNCFIIGNEADEDGGGVYCENISALGKTAILNSVIQGNKAQWGGGLYNGARDVPTEVTDTLFMDNESIKSGAGIYNAVTSDLNVTRGQIRWNDVTGTAGAANTRAGGGVFIEGGDVNLMSVLIDSNSATGAGGGIFVKAAGSLSLMGCTVTNNWCGPGGGTAIYLTNGAAFFQAFNTITGTVVWGPESRPGRSPA